MSCSVEVSMKKFEARKGPMQDLEMGDHDSYKYTDQPMKNDLFRTGCRATQ